MSREFDKRVRDLHEAPLTFDNVKGKAMTIRRNRRIAVAGGILAAAAVIVPVAVLAGNGLGDADDGPDFGQQLAVAHPGDRPQRPDAADRGAGAAVGVSYLEGSTWHRADGSTVELDETYYSAVELGDQLVATTQRQRQADRRRDRRRRQRRGLVPDLLHPGRQRRPHHGRVHRPPTGSLMTRWADGEVAMGEGFVDGDSVAAITGGPNCYEVVDGCVGVRQPRRRLGAGGRWTPTASATW